MPKRKHISRKDRFEIFKRDSFTCQYCGASAPETILHIDHIVPISKGGEDDVVNYITACANCNLGKGDRELNDNTVIKKRKSQLDELQERREQIEMMLEWQQGLVNIENEAVDAANQLIGVLFDGFLLNDNGKREIKRAITRYGFSEVLECIRISANQYLKRNSEGRVDRDSAIKAYAYISKIAANRKRTQGKPYMSDLYYIRGIVRNRMYCTDWLAIQLMEKAYNKGVGIDDLKQLALDAKNWTEWQASIKEWIERGET